jgi:hypothetical protein
MRGYVPALLDHHLLAAAVERHLGDRVPWGVLGGVVPGREVVHLLIAVHEVHGSVVVWLLWCAHLGALAGCIR